MGKGFKLPGKLPGAPAKIAMPAAQQGGSYRNPAMIIDRSAEILGAGIQSGMDKIGDALKQKAMDKIAEEKGQEPQSNLDKEIQKEKLDSTAIDASTKLDAFQPTNIPVLDSQAEGFLRKFNSGFDDSAIGMVDDELAAVGTPVDLPETPLQMKNDSPNKFVGGLASIATGGGGSGVNNSGLTQQQMQNAIAPGGKFIGFGNMAKMIKNQAAGMNQAQQTAAASTAAQNPMAGGIAAAGQAVGGASGGQTSNCTPVAMSYDPPLQANEKGGKKSVFNMNTKGMAEAAFGTPAMRQASVGAAFQMSKTQEDAFGPGGHSENPGLYKQLK